VEHGPDRQDDEVDADGDPARPEPTGPSTGGVRIIGAETAAEITSELPVVPPAHIAKDTPTHASVRIIDETAAPDEAVTEDGSSTDAAHAELPHWTEPATGQVPAVLARDDDGGPTDGILPPTWREEDADWTAHEEGFEPAMFSDERASLGALDETDSTDEERRPWEFDLDSVKPGQPGPSSTASTTDPITEPVPAVIRADEPNEGLFEHTETVHQEPAFTGEATMAVSASEVAAAATSRPADTVATGPSEDEHVTGSADQAPADVTPVDDAARPSGTARVGRARRSGLLPARLKAKRPDDADGTLSEPLAAEPPGASVADVPGAGRRKTGLAGLAAADRLAEQGHASDDAAATSSTPAAITAEAEASEADETRSRRSRRRSGEDRPLRSSSNYTPDVTGGGPPPPVPERRARREREAGVGSTGLRVGTGVAVAVVALLAFKIGTVTALVLCLLVVTFAAGEAFAVLRRAGWRPATLLGLVGTISLMVGAYDKGIAALPLVLVLITAFTLLWYLFGVERGSAVAGTASTLLVVGWVAVLGSYAGLLLDPTAFPDRHGIAFLLGAIIATVANDVGALIVGRWIGSRQLAPNVSPNKTWEGLVGGALASILVSTVVVGAIHPWSPANAALLGVVVAVVAPLGDLCESLLKRDLRLKDMGSVLPGHGGVLDRVDALLFVLPATYYLVRALNIG
jgi:phosphatidate cytidylyltransferase